jgi:N-acetylglucosaminyldiphosphoundecaprenol N-acetyl-beta-D-mannosaminyltransferase
MSSPETDHRTENAGAPPETSVCPVLGCPLALTDYAGAVEQVREWARRADRAYAVEAANTHVVALARHDPAFRAAMSAFDLWLPDGMPLVWSMNRRVPADRKLRDRVYGPTFMLHCLAATEGNEAEGHFLLGGSDELLAALQTKLLARFPRLRIAGVCAPPFGTWPPGEDERILAQIEASKARFIWVGLGCPKQEFWISRYRSRLPAGVYFGIGAAFAFHAGRVRQAPGWMQRAGLEWLFRLLAEPRRLFRRYFVYNSLFLYYLAREEWRRRA